MHLVALLEATQNGNGVLFIGLLDQYLLKAPLQRRILLDVLPIFIEGRGAHAMQFSPGQCGLEHIARVHGALRLAGAHHGVQFVHKQNDAALFLRQGFEHRLQPLFKVAPKFRSGQQCTQIQSQYALVLKALWHLTVHNALRQTLNDGRLAHAGLADQYGVIFGSSLQHLNRATNFIVAADNRIQLPGGCALRQINGVFLQCLARLLRFSSVDSLAAPRCLNCLGERLGGHTRLAE